MVRLFAVKPLHGVRAVSSREARTLPPTAHPLSQPLDPGLQLGHAGLLDGGATTHPAQFGVDQAVGFSCRLRVEPDEAVEQASLLLEGPVQGRRHVGLRCDRRRRPRRRPLGLPCLALGEQFVDLVGFEKSGKPDEVEFLICSRFGVLAELGAVEDDPVEGG